MASIPPLEIRALAGILDELDYYRLLNLERGAPASEIKAAFHRTSRAYHPDANRDLEPELRIEVERISKRVTEAYTVLRDPRRRKAYDDKLGSGDGVRIQLAEARQKQAKATATTPQGQQFLKKAQQDMNRGDYASAARNLQTARTFEPQNEYLKDLLAEAKRKAD